MVNLTCRRGPAGLIKLGMGALVVVAGWLIYCKLTQPTPSTQEPSHAAPRTPADPDERARRLLVGVWEDEYQGKRTLTLQQDGTGTMLVELSGLKAMLFASSLRFEMVWSVEAGRLKKRTTGGEPASQVQLILKTMGDRVDEKILKLTEDRLLLLDQDGETKYDWRRAETAR